MLLAGDERGNSQGGNNNVYCQDNEISWIDWTPEAKAHASAEALHDFVARLIALRRRHPSFRRRSFFRGQLESDTKDVLWLRPDGVEMTPPDWEGEHVRCLGMLFSGTGLIDVGPRGEPQRDDDFLLLLNAYHEPLPFSLPPREDTGWIRLVDTAQDDAAEVPAPPGPYPLQGRSLALFRAAMPQATP
jgi:isoamylase